MKERNPKALAIAVETEGSVLGGGPKGDHEVEGIGASFIPKTFDASLADEIIAVTDRDAFDMVKKLAAVEGVLAGSSCRGECVCRDRNRAKAGAGQARGNASFPTPPSATCRRASSSSGTRSNITTEARRRARRSDLISDGINC